jgi:hypothetical protein
LQKSFAMWRDALRTVAIAARRFVLGVALLSGAALTVRVAWFGWHLDPRCITGVCPGAIRTAKVRVKMAREAAIQYELETPSCPHSIDELVAGRFLDQWNARDPWGSPLSMQCPGFSNEDGDADFTSLGPDKVLGTADDINSWDR